LLRPAARVRFAPTRGKGSVNSQNRMNAGAEYVLYRIWATLQEREAVHAESLLACMGALAGYACQAYARQAGAQLDVPLTTSPLSVWALVRRAVQKIGKPLPDFDDISAHVAKTLGTATFGLPRVPDEHRPHQQPIFYVRQLWPQVLPLAQRFYRRPAQLPVLFGIALQRAIEHTAGRLDPTLAASIAMESAVAMSKAELPDGLRDLFLAPAVAADIAITSKTLAVATLPDIRATTPKRARAARPAESDVGAFIARLPTLKVAASIMSLAIIGTLVNANWTADKRKNAAVTARIERPVGVGMPALRPSINPFARPIEESRALTEDAPAPDVQSVQSAPQSAPQPAEDLGLPAPTPDNSEGIITDEGQSA
jgi:hypothetical protein